MVDVWIGLLSKVPEMAMVVIMVLYTLELSKVHRVGIQDVVNSSRDVSEKIMEDWRTHMAKESEKWRERIESDNSIWRAHSNKESERWRDFIKELKDSQNDAIARLAEEIKNNTKAMAVASETIARHEAKADVGLSKQ